jgi:hypothetical protein
VVWGSERARRGEEEACVRQEQPTTTHLRLRALAGARLEHERVRCRVPSRAGRQPEAVGVDAHVESVLRDVDAEELVAFDLG